MLMIKSLAQLFTLKLPFLHNLEYTMSLADLFKKRQEILLDMNQACLKAITKAKKPFLSKLEEIEKEYAFLLQFTADNKEK